MNLVKIESKEEAVFVDDLIKCKPKKTYVQCAYVCIFKSPWYMFMYNTYMYHTWKRFQKFQNDFKRIKKNWG